jgi:hypothetical protein
MTQQSNNPSSSNSSTVAYFNAHTEGLGYLDSLVEVTPKPGQTFAAFWTAVFCMLEGNPKEPEKLYVSLTVPADKALDVLKPYLADINNQTIKVFAGLRLAKFRGVPFMYGDNSKTPGVLGINYSARLISVIYLKVGDSVIKLPRNDAQATTDYGVPVGSNSNIPAQNSQTLFDQPLIVKLAKNAPNFAATKDRLKATGYRWHTELEAWVLPEVKLAKNDPDFEQKSQLLKTEGYRWSNEHNSWRMTFGKPSQNNRNGYSNSNQQRAQ